MCTILWMLFSTANRFDNTVTAAGVIFSVALDLIIVTLYSVSKVAG